MRWNHTPAEIAVIDGFDSRCSSECTHSPADDTLSTCLKQVFGKQGMYEHIIARK